MRTPGRGRARAAQGLRCAQLRNPGDSVKTLEDQMAVYAAYHRNRWNRLTHFIGVPAIIFAILIPMSWVSFGEGVSLAHLFLGAVLAYYFLLDAPLALATAVAVGALFYPAKLAAGTDRKSTRLNS